jgi:C1q domain
VPIHGDGRAGYGTGSQTIILSLKTDDHVWIQLSKDSALLNDYTTFSGYLLFED